MKSCINCKLQFICVPFSELRKVLDSAKYMAAFDDSKLIPGVHGRCYLATALNCGYYENDGEIIEEAPPLSNAEQFPCPQCEKPRGMQKIGGYVSPCPNCGDLCPF